MRKTIRKRIQKGTAAFAITLTAAFLGGRGEILANAPNQEAASASGNLIGPGHPRHDILMRISDLEWEIVANVHGWGSLNANDFTPASWQQMAAALTAARDMQETDWQLNLTDAQINTMYNTLRAGLDGLVPAGGGSGNHQVPPTTPPPAAGQSGTTTANLNLRRGAGTQHGIIRTLPNGSALTILQENNGWMQVRAGSDTGWVSAQFVRLSDGSLGTTPPAQPPAASREGHTIANLNLRAAAGTNQRLIRTLPNGSALTILQESNGWMQVRAGSDTGWVSAQFVRDGAGPGQQAPPAQERQGHTTHRLNLRRGAGTGYGIITTLGQNINVTILSESNGWMRVRAGNQEGFVSAQFIRLGSAGSPGATPPPAAQRQGRTIANLNLRQGAGTQHGIIRTLPVNTQITILSEADGWMRIQSGGQEGWVSAQFVQVS